MKKVFAFALILVAVFGFVQIIEPPAHAGVCEDACYQDYLDCLELSNNPNVICPNLYEGCLGCCPGH